MVKAYSQIIPSQYYSKYRLLLTGLRFTGFQYWIDEYNYGLVGLTQKVCPHMQLSRAGLDRLRQSKELIWNRREFFKYVYK